jgi:hypothetical protein
MLLQRGEMPKGLILVANSEQTAKELIPSVWSSHQTARANQAQEIEDLEESGGSLIKLSVAYCKVKNNGDLPDFELEVSDRWRNDQSRLGAERTEVSASGPVLIIKNTHRLFWKSLNVERRGGRGQTERGE